MKTTIYNTQGKEAGTFDVPETVFNQPWNADLVHQVVVSMQANRRAGTALAHTKDRSEVSGGGKKPWKQKGTGRARHGSRRSPIWIGGGVSHGPRNDKDYSKKINKKMRKKALYVALSEKLRNGRILFVDNMNLSAPKTKEAVASLKGLETIAGFETINTPKHNNIFMVVPERDTNTALGFRNLGHTTIEDVRNLNVLDVMKYRYLIISTPEKSMSVLLGETSDNK
ncbi:MAG: 50S ribosomal protein L4 [Candidatus Nomurabacteria bacterium]|nr:50S ribosomal protein L4 [Candidatus Nomurabacteria bacterium]